MSKNLFIFILLVFIPWPGQADCPPSELLLQLNQAKEAANVVRASMTNNIEKFCTDNVMNNLSLTVTGTAPDIMDKDIEMGSNPLNINSQDDPWLNSLFPHEKMRIGVFSRHQTLRLYGINSLTDLKATLSGTKPLAKYHPEKDFQKAVEISAIEQKKFDQGEEIARTNSSLARHGICVLTPVLNVKACAQGLDRIVDIMKPKSRYTLLPLYKDVLEDPRYKKGLVTMANRIIERIEKGGNPNADLQSDLLASFKDSGLSEKEAEDLTWNTLGLIATGGPNIGWRLAGLQSSESSEMVKIALMAISSGALVLDSRSRGSGQLYSYPSKVKTDCDHGKPYHFWMTAYLARRLTLENGNPEGSAAAAFIAQKGYQMLSKQISRDPLRAFVSDTFDPVNNVVRMDLAYASAGAVYGAMAAKGKQPQELDVNRGLRKVVTDSKIMPRLNDSDLGGIWEKLGFAGFTIWENKFAPNAAFEIFRKELQ